MVYKVEDQHRFIHSIHETSSPGYSFNSTRLTLDTLIEEQTSNSSWASTTTTSEQGTAAILSNQDLPRARSSERALEASQGNINVFILA